MNDFLASHTQETYSPDQLLVEGPLRTWSVTIVSGQNITRGAVLGKITASGKYALSDEGAVDGSEDPSAIAAVDVDATGGDVTGVPVYVGADVNENKLNFGGTNDADSVRDALRALGIWLHPAIAVE